MSKTVSLLVIFIISIVILIGLVRQIKDALEAGSRLDTATDEVNSLQAENRALKQKLENTKSFEFIEQIARNNLNLGRPNETVVIIQEDLINNLINAQKKVEEPKLPNWQGWLKLFFR
ncbi:MAG: hypothetical protein ACD_30C00110G0008 [uncultured bacterium]|uniref:Cell division protein FtsL n=2 Tax=Candidatus Daviesiibacteriota TaxID=1752718 RepID=A0A1F5K6B0_9BACT|nr:MAG: hypothetical protein ACD_30C00110G0008 [uncultured bacterium]KKQ15685.1 MAG: Septum formation initiator [Candidatus Daviesbacteria bacterium GW2011_GWA1_36_8]OGE33039.1 MAG: hypothetical protein A3C99_02090 [Candidatus Daviesbacteria bacterium RIFCSPHIGHO2_02_FULL_37_9]OGE36211.1 MAG: hypothetical protein A3E66_05395 [Candidatus Daviesbacteria bacterium RIFCSPHIGHO2_12_FULL_37_16]